MRFKHGSQIAASCAHINLNLSPKKTNSIPPIPFGGFLEKLLERADQPAKVRRWNRLFIHEYDATVITARLRPCFQQWRNGLPVIGDEREFLSRCFLEKQIVGQTHEATAFPLRQTPEKRIFLPAAETLGDIGRDLLVKKKL